MPQPLHRQLLTQARHLARRDARRPQQGNLRRAVSSSYYALFHFLIHHATRSVVGTAAERRDYRHALARAFDHGEMAAASKSFSGGTLPASVQQHIGTPAIPAELRSIATLFVEAQDLRHRADYNLSEAFFRKSTLALVDRVDDAMRDFDSVRSQPVVRFFLTSLLVWKRIAAR